MIILSIFILFTYKHSSTHTTVNRSSGMFTWLVRTN